ncbi:MAG: DUF1254 domain-containing protein [Pseudomonadota bacterium]
MKAVFGSVGSLICFFAFSSGQCLQIERPLTRLTEARAVEAMIWGMPAVNTDLMRQAILHSTTARPNDIIFWSRPVNWKNQTLTPNPDSIYFMSFWDVRAGPVVIDVPPAQGGSIAGNIVDVWQMPLEDAGPEGADQGKGGKYIIVPPNFHGDVPAGFFVLRADTYTGFALMRSNLKSHSDVDIAKSVAYGKRLRIYRLSESPRTNFIDVFDKMFDSTIRYDASFYENLNRIVQTEPWLQRDRVMIDGLRSIGIEKGKPYRPDANLKLIMDHAANEAHDWLSRQYDAGFPVMNAGIRWFPAARADVVRAVSTGYANVDEYPVDARGVTYTLGFTGIKRIGTAQFYLMVAHDKTGAPFDGNKMYRLTVPANAPVRQYWSVTAYDRETHALIKQTDHPSVASISPEVEKNGDGTVSVFFGPEPPAGRQANWVQTDPSGKFELLFRLYGPEKPLFDGTWKLPDVERLSSNGE